MFSVKNSSFDLHELSPAFHPTSALNRTEVETSLYGERKRGTQKMGKAFVLWFTGLPNSGKTTVSRLVAQRLESLGTRVELIDSDEVPRSLTKELNADWVIRQKQKCSNLIYVAKVLYKHNVNVLIASVGRFQEMRDTARSEIPDFVEVFLKCPLDVRIERDDKAKYQRYAQTIHYYEEPHSPEIIIDSANQPSEEAAGKVIQYLDDNGYI